MELMTDMVYLCMRSYRQMEIRSNHSMSSWQHRGVEPAIIGYTEDDAFKWCHR